MTKRKRATVLPNNIASLQNLIRRDPPSYREEFLLQHRHYASLRDIYLQNPDEAGESNEREFSDLIGFVAQMCSCYPKDTKVFPEEIATLLKKNHSRLPAQIKEKIVQSLTMLRNKGTISSDTMIQNLFPLLVSTESKQMRSQIFTSIIALLRSENKGAKNQKLNRSVQALLFSLLVDDPANGLWATKITRELWRRGVWDDSRAVEIMSLAASNRENVKVASAGARFFLDADKEREDAQNENSDDEDDIDVSALKHQSSVNKRSMKREKKIEAARKTYKKKHSSTAAPTFLNFSAIQLLRDPQNFAETIFRTHLVRGNSGLDGDGVVHRARLPLERTILFLTLVSRLVGMHKLSVLGLYSFFLNFLKPKQPDVTKFLAASAQASHDLVPPEYITPIIKKIALEFVSDGVAPEVAAAGLNSIREVVARAPLAIDQTLLHDLIQYRGSKSKPVMMAARSLIGLFREIDPSMLPSKERGKTAALSLKSGEANELKYGIDRSAITEIEGLGLLKKWKEEQQANGDGDGDEDEKDGWEIDSNSESDDSDSEDEGEWVTVESDGEYEVSDSDDDKDDDDDEDKDGNDEDEGEDGDKKVTKKAKREEQLAAAKENAASLLELASSTVLTPADFAKLDELRMKEGVDKILGRGGRNEEEVDVARLTGPLKYKQTREERIAASKEGKEGREFRSKKGEKLAQKAHSTTNREKARKKNFMMLIHKRDVQGKAKRSLRDKQKILKAHIKKQKMKK